MSRPDRPVSYAVVLRTPGAPRTFTAATLARLSYGTLSLSLLLTVQAATGSFAVAGAAVGVFGIPAVLLPLKSRWIDRYGRRRVLGPLAVSYATALLVIAGLDVSGTAAAAPYLAASAVAGLLTPPVGPVMRSIWAALAPGPAARQRAYTLDAVVEETVFTISPLLVGVLVTTTRPVVALVVTALLALVGALGLATSTLHGQLPPPQVGGIRRDSRSPLTSAPLRRVLLVMLTAGVGLSLLELAVVARAAESGNLGVAGYLLAALSVGSATGGLLWGRLQHRRTHQVQLVRLLLALAAGTLLAALAPGLLALGVVLGLIGLAVAPVYVVAYLAADLLSQPGTRTEATTWVATASNLGGAAGAAVAGYLIDQTSPRTTTLIAGVVLALATLALTSSTARAQACGAARAR